MRIRTTILLALLVTQFSTGGAFYLDSVALAQDQSVPKAGEESSTREMEAKRTQELRQQFLTQELITAKPGAWILKPGDTPRIVWRDLEEVRRLGFDGNLRVRWFDAKLNESDVPGESGRWAWSRRSTSSWVPPSPRAAPAPPWPPPEPPPWRSRCAHMRVSLGREYSRRASSTCRRPSLVRARRAKISRIRSVRS